YGVLESYLGQIYINDFTLYGKSYKVMMQGEQKYRDQKEDILRLQVKTPNGKMVPMSALGSVRTFVGPDVIERYNLFPSMKLTIVPKPGVSSGQVVKTMEDAAKALPPGFAYEWTGTTFQELKAGSAAVVIFALSLLTVYLLLAAQYESWLLPLSVLLSMPFGVLGAAVALKMMNLPFDLYGQIGMVVLVGLIAKNAILIVEFAVEQRKEGKSPLEAAVTAAKLRLRPILMTAGALILGMIPLVMATGAGAGSRNSLGITLLGGMLIGTFLGVLTVPVFYYMMETLSSWGRKPVAPGEQPPVAAHDH